MISLTEEDLKDCLCVEGMVVDNNHNSSDPTVLIVTGVYTRDTNICNRK